MSKCAYCEREMTATDSCLRWMFNYNGVELKAIIHQDKENRDCPDCGVGVGGYHHPHCDQEVCPRCGGQYISCGCMEEETIQ